MFGALGMLLGGGVHGPAHGVRLIQPGALASGNLLTFTRAQVGGARSTARGSDGASIAEFLADAPRFHDISRGLLLEGQRTNGVRNPRGEGAVAGTPGALPTNASLIGDASLGVVTRAVAVSAISAGRSRMTITASGTATSTGLLYLILEPAGVVSATPNEIWTFSVNLGLSAASNVSSCIQRWDERQGSTYLRSLGSGNIIAGLGSVPTAQVLVGTVGANTDNIAPVVVFGVAGAGAWSLTIAYDTPQIERGTGPSTPILPAASMPAASTRGADGLSGSLATLLPNGVGTILGRAMVPQLAPAGAPLPVIVVADDGTSAAQVFLSQVQGSANVNLRRIAGGNDSSATLGLITAGSSFSFGLALGGASVWGSLNGAAVQEIVTQPAGLTTMRFGNGFSGGNSMGGQMLVLDVLPYAIPPASLPAAVLAM